MDEIMEGARAHMEKTLAALVNEFGGVRVGRASAAVLDRIAVDYYGTPTPIPQMAAVSTPDPRTLQIQPYDASTLKAVEKAILASDLGITPMNDGRVLRLGFPPLTEERRRDLAKQVTKMAEEAKIAVRAIRRDAIEKYKAAKKRSEITEDDLKDAEKDTQELTDRFCKDVDAAAAKKEKEILEF